MGSPIYRDHVPDQDGLIIERLRAAVCLCVPRGDVKLGKATAGGGLIESGESR